MSETIRYASLFSGIGGFEKGLNAVGMECVFASEWDKFAQISYEAIHGTKPVGDITEYNASDIPDHELLVAGFPCQSFSVAGRRGGFEDTRGTLVFDVVRIMDEKKPQMVLMENVKNLVSHDKGRTMNTIVTALNECGYRVDFTVLNSKYFGVPQNRERVYIVCIREDLMDNDPWYIEGKGMVAKAKQRIADFGDIKSFNFDYPEENTVDTQLWSILETDVDDKYFYNEEKTSKLLEQLKRVGDEVKDTSEPHMVGHLDIGGHDILKRVYDEEGMSPTLNSMSGGNRQPKVAVRQYPIDYSRKTGVGEQRDTSHCLSASDWRGLNRNQKQNAVVEVRPTLTPDRVNKRQNGRRFKENGEEAFTLTSQDRHGVTFYDGSDYRIRKLTPKECWRLQAFSDTDFQKAVNAGVSNSQLYKQSGNAVTTTVVQALGQKIEPYISL